MTWSLFLKRSDLESACCAYIIVVPVCVCVCVWLCVYFHIASYGYSVNNEIVY